MIYYLKRRKERDIQFRMHGDGQLKNAAVRQAEAMELNNVTFTDWLTDATRLSYEFAPYQVCLGAFGETAASRMTIQNKVYEGMAMRKAVITGDSLTVRAAFTDGEHLILCPREDPTALAEAIVALRDNPGLCQQIAEEGYRAFRSGYTTEAVGRVAKKHLQEHINQRS